MSEQIILALIVAIPAIIASAIIPTIVLMINNNNARRIKEFDAKIHKQEKIDDYARADALEERRNKKSDEVANILKINTAAQVTTAGETRGQLVQIHALVNSNLTSEMEARLAVMQTGLASLIEIAGLRKALGHSESEGAMALVNSTKEKINSLISTLETRKQVTESSAVDKRVTETATAAAVAALTAAGPLQVTIQQDDTNPVPVKQLENK